MTARVRIMTLMNTEDASVQALYFEDDGATPNSRFPVLFYRLKLDPSGTMPAHSKRCLRLTNGPRCGATESSIITTFTLTLMRRWALPVGRRG